MRWDRGDEFWEILDDSIAHFRIVSRELLPSGEVQETVELLPETPIPSEVFACYLPPQQPPRQIQGLLPLRQAQQRQGTPSL